LPEPSKPKPSKQNKKQKKAKPNLSNTVVEQEMEFPTQQPASLRATSPEAESQVKFKDSNIFTEGSNPQASTAPYTHKMSIPNHSMSSD